MELRRAKKITIFTSEEKKFNQRPLYEVLQEEFSRLKIKNVVVLRGMAGFGGGKKVHITRIEVLSYNLPVTIEATDLAGKIDQALPRIV